MPLLSRARHSQQRLFHLMAGDWSHFAPSMPFVQTHLPSLFNVCGGVHRIA
jgi:hypothetical protein